MTPGPADFHRLGSRIRLRGQLRTVTAIRVGAAEGGGEDVADLPLVLGRRELPFIPGATIKGVLRSTIASLVRAAENESRDIWTCHPLDDDAKQRHTRTACGVRERGRRSEIDSGRTCAVCRLLGSHTIASHVLIRDAMLLNHCGPNPIERRDFVAIGRDGLTAYRNCKYQFDVVAAGACFGLEVLVKNPRAWLMGLLTIGWDQIADGYITLGGSGFSGLGRVAIEWEEAEVFSATSRLLNQPPTRWTSELLENQRVQWRGALAERHGGIDVQG